MNQERKYEMLLVELFDLRCKGQDETEILERLDEVWFQLTTEEVGRITNILAEIEALDYAEILCMLKAQQDVKTAQESKLKHLIS